MRIISKFHDYYDVGLAQGHDRALVFVRETQNWSKTNVTELPPFIAAFREHIMPLVPPPLSISKSVHKHYQSVAVAYGVLLFAGLLYPFAEVSASRRFGEPAARHHVYDLADLDSCLAPHGFDIHARKARGAFSFLRGGSAPKEAGFFAASGVATLLPLALEHDVAVASYCQRTGLRVNPQAAQFELYRRIGAWQAFQELAMFKGNIAAPDLTPASVSDKDRIQQHGFDKWSFRKLPSNGRT